MEVKMQDENKKNDFNEENKIESIENNFDNGAASQVTNFNEKEKSEQTEIATKENKSKKFFKGLVKGLAYFFVLNIFVILVWVIYCFFSKTKIENYVPEDFSFYVSTPSASKFFSQTLQLQALDEVFAGLNIGDAYSLVKTLRSNDFISSKFFSFLANVRLDLVLCPSENETEVYLFADLKLRSCLTRLLPIILKLKPHLFYDLNLEQISYSSDKNYFVTTISESSKVYFRFYKNIFIAKISSDPKTENTFESILKPNEVLFRKKLIEDLSKNKKGSLNILANLNLVKPVISSSNEILKKILEEVDFPNRSNLNIQIKNTDIKIASDIKVQTNQNELKNILSNRGSIPKVLNRIPEETEYFTVLNFSTPDELLANLQPFLPKDIKQTLKNADRYLNMLFGKGLNELLLSWIGEEVGVFAIDSINAPVFFLSIKDKKKCNAFFGKIFDSILIDQNSTTIVDGIRISRIDFPAIIEGLLKLFKIDLPKPFYFIDDDFVFFSQSSEGIAHYKASYDSKDVITKNESWKTMLKNISPETSYFLYYDIDRSVPNFLVQNKTLSEILLHYGRGLFSFKIENNQNASFSFYAVQKERRALKRISGFPKQVEGRLYDKLHFAKTQDNTPYVFWSSDDKLYSYNLNTDKMQSSKVDSNATITLDIKSGKLKNVLALTKNGTVYKMDENLNSHSPFPVLTTYKSVDSLVCFDKKVIFSAQDVSNIIIVDNNGDIKLSDELFGKMIKAPVIAKNFIVALPRSFDSQVQFFSKDGKSILSPIELSNISAIKPIVFESKKAEYKKMNPCIINITEDGIYTIHGFSGDEIVELTTTELKFSCRTQPVYCESLKALLVLDTEGILHLLNLDGSQKLSTKIPNASENTIITVKDITGDGIDEIFISGAGNAVYGYSGTLIGLEGFPISGASNPVFVDVNSDGVEDILTFGVDSKLHVFEGFF